MKLVRCAICIVLAFLVFFSGCEKKEEDPITGTPDTTTDSGFVYEVDKAPAVLAEGYFGLLEMTKPFQGYPELHSDTVVLYISGSSSFTYYLLHVSHGTNLCDTEGKLAFGKGGLTVFDSRVLLGTICDSLRVPYGPLTSAYTESTLVMDSSRVVTTGTGDTEKITYHFDLRAFNLFNTYTGEMTIIEYRFGTIDSLTDSVSLNSNNGLFEMNTYSDSDQVCDADGRILVDVPNQSLTISVDSLITGTGSCDMSLSPEGQYRAEFRFDGMVLDMMKRAPIPGSSADSISFRFEFTGM